MSLLSRLTTPNPIVKEESYYILLDTHVDYFKKHSKTKYISVTGLQAEKYKGDFHGLLNYLAIDKKLHYLITRMNNLYSSSDYDGELLSIMIPEPGAVAQVIATYSSIES